MNVLASVTATSYPAGQVYAKNTLAISTVPCDLNPPAPGTVDGLDSTSVKYGVGTVPVKWSTGKPTAVALTPGRDLLHQRRLAVRRQRQQPLRQPDLRGGSSLLPELQSPDRAVEAFGTLTPTLAARAPASAGARSFWRAAFVAPAMHGNSPAGK